MNKKLNNVLIAVLAAGALALAGTAVWIVLHPEQKAVKRQETEESLAQAYIEALGSRAAAAEQGTEAEKAETSAEESAEASDENEEAANSSAEGGDDSEHVSGEPDAYEEASADGTAEETSGTFSDDNYYERDGVTYTPDYAMGELLGVLEVDRAGIRRGVYGGSWEAIDHDLDIWMVTEARPDYVIGETHFVIYGHNHTVQDLSFNRLKDVQVGDVFTYSTDDGVYIYDVTDFFADWRELVTSDIVDNFLLPADQMYIVTCGRNEYRYKDIVVVGTLRCVMDPAVYQADEEYYKYDEEAIAAEKRLAADGSVISSAIVTTGAETATEAADGTTAETTQAKKEAVLTLDCGEDGKLIAACTDENGNELSCSLGIFDMDGISVVRWNQTEEEMPEIALEDGTNYVFGVVRMEDEKYEAPAELVFKYHGTSIKELPLEEEETDSAGLPLWVKPVVFGLLALILVLIVILLIPGKKKKSGDEGNAIDEKKKKNRDGTSKRAWRARKRARKREAKKALKDEKNSGTGRDLKDEKSSETGRDQMKGQQDNE